MRFGLIILVIAINAFIFADAGLVPLGDSDKLDLVYPNQVVEGPDKNIYVYDAKDSFIKVFSSSGKLLKTIAGPGEGPGYIKREDGVNFGFTLTKLIYISEYYGGHRWITLLNLEGTLQGTINPQINNPMYGVERIYSIQDGSFLVEFAFAGLPEKKGAFYLHSAPQAIYHMDANGKLLTKLKETNFFQRISYFNRGADYGLPYVPTNLWAPYQNGTILFTDGMDNALKILNYKGDTIGHIDTELPAVPLVTVNDLVKWRNFIKKQMTATQNGKERYEKFGKVIEEYKTPIYKKKPYIHSLDVTPTGNILISSLEEPEVNERNLWLLNSRGKILAQIKSDLSDLKFSLHYIFIKKRDAEENMLVYFLNRNSCEDDDFKNLFRCLETFPKNHVSK